MKKIFYLLLLVSLFIAGELANGMPPLPTEPGIKLLRVSQTGVITVELSNPSKSALKIWQGSNSWGAACWRVLLIRHGHVEAFFQNPYQIFTANAPIFDEIAPGARLERSLDLNGGNWCGFGHCASYNERGIAGKRISVESNDVIVAVYDVPPTREATDMGVWRGVIAALKTVE